MKLDDGDGELARLDASRRVGWAKYFDERRRRLALERRATADPWKPTRTMARVSDLLEGATLPASAVIDCLDTKAAIAREAIARLLAEGHVEEVRRDGIVLLVLVRPYRETP